MGLAMWRWTVTPRSTPAEWRNKMEPSRKKSSHTPLRANARSCADHKEAQQLGASFIVKWTTHFHFAGRSRVPPSKRQ
jgi:hypothetical protein